MRGQKKLLSVKIFVSIGVAVALFWAGIILTLAVIDFDGLIILLAKYIASDGIIVLPLFAVGRVALAPIGVVIAIWVGRVAKQMWFFSNKLLVAYLFLFATHLVFFTIFPLFAPDSLYTEDGFLEWATFAFALAASVLFFVSGYRGARIAFLLSAAWLIFAFEEISWGQRILGFESSELFEEYNYQNEANLHNFLNPYFIVIYPAINFALFSFLTWLRKIKLLRRIYQIPGLSHILKVSDAFGLWIFPYFLTFTSFFPGEEFVEEQWSIFGFVFASVLLLSGPKSGAKSLGQSSD